MSRSPAHSFEQDTVEDGTRVPAASAGALAPAPMPSLMSHPPLRLQRKPVPGTILKELPGSSSSISPPISPLLERTFSQEGSPAYDAESLPFGQENPTEGNLIPCPFCPAVFKKVGHLNRHTLKHTGTRFPCDVAGCDKTFSRLDNMRTHVKNMHPASGEPAPSQRPRSALRTSPYDSTHPPGRTTYSEQPEPTN